MNSQMGTACPNVSDYARARQYLLRGLALARPANRKGPPFAWTGPGGWSTCRGSGP